MAHSLDGVVVQLVVRRPYLFWVAGYEGLTQGAAQSFGIGAVYPLGFFSLEPEVRDGEAVLASGVDEGLPLWVGEVYARLALCRRGQVAHGPIVRWRSHASMPTWRYSPGVQPALE
jgi:hypothetical protein